MTLSEIRQECWDAARETATIDSDRLWTRAEMNRYINRVYRFIAKETLCIRDAVTPEICQLASNVIDYTTYTPGTQDYIWANDPNSWLYHANVCPYIFPLDSRILMVDEVKWTYRQWKLRKVTVGKWQRNVWWEQVRGMPTEYALDYSANTLVINFRDDMNDILRLIVRRMPLVPLAADGDTPEFRASYHDFFLNGVLELMYRKQDVETFDLAKANDYHAMFMQDIDEIKQEETKLDDYLRPNAALDAFR